MDCIATNWRILRRVKALGEHHIDSGTRFAGNGHCHRVAALSGGDLKNITGRQRVDRAADCDRRGPVGTGRGGKSLFQRQPRGGQLGVIGPVGLLVRLRVTRQVADHLLGQRRMVVQSGNIVPSQDVGADVWSGNP